MTPDDRDMLIRIDENTKALKKAVFGNGTPGLVSRVQTIETSYNEHLKQAVSPRQWPAIVSATIAVIMCLWVVFG